MNGARMAMPTGSTSSSTTEPQQYAVTEAPQRCPSHPGELLREILADGLELSVAEAARQLGVSRMTLHRLLRGEQAVTPEMALRLGEERCQTGEKVSGRKGGEKVSGTFSQEPFRQPDCHPPALIGAEPGTGQGRA
jgi:addiction module HigA family antidote